DDCDCGGVDSEGANVCLGTHIVCQGHCNGHDCLGYADHEDYNCNCECTCGEDQESGHEISIVAQKSQIAGIVTKVCEVLLKHGSTVNDTCGLHVHLDMRGTRDVKQSFANLVK